MTTIIIDKRERNGPLPFMEEVVNAENYANSNRKDFGGEITWIDEQITTGDFVIKLGDMIKVILERKTFDDLASSIKDGRANSQIEKMEKLKAETGASIMFIIEGPKTHFKEKQGISFDAIESKLRHIALRGIPYLRTVNAKDTAILVVQLARDVARGYGIVSVSEEQKVESNHQDLLKRTIKPEMHSEQENLWKSIPGIGDKIAKTLLKKLTMGQFLRSDEKEMKKMLTDINIEYSLGVGPKKISTLLSLLRDPKDIIETNQKKDLSAKILGSIHGMSVETAKIILETHPLQSLAKGEVERYMLADIQRVNKRKLGADVADKIITLLEQ